MISNFKPLLAFIAVTAVNAQTWDQHTCVEMFQHHNAGGWRVHINASRKTGSGQWYFWDDDSMSGHDNNAVSSFKVPAGCQFTPSCNFQWRYTMKTFYGPTYINLVRSWNDCISSYKCWCDPSLKAQRVRNFDPYVVWQQNKSKFGRRLGVDTNDQALVGNLPAAKMDENEPVSLDWTVYGRNETEIVDVDVSDDGVMPRSVEAAPRAFNIGDLKTFGSRVNEVQAARAPRDFSMEDFAELEPIEEGESTLDSAEIENFVESFQK